MRRYFILSLWGCLFFLFLTTGKGEAETLRVPKRVKDALLKSGISRKTLDACFKGPFDKVEIGIILKNVTHKEVMADYRQFLKKETIRKAKKYLLEHKKVFAEIEKTYDVPKEVVASILMVESSFGENGGKYQVFSVYASLAALSDKKIKKRVVREAAKAGEDVQARRFRKRVDRKGKWGMKELLCLIRLSEQKKIDFTQLKGSWAGAFGMPQFIPSSFEAYGIDWDGDGRVDLDMLPDAVASVSNYLKKHGWKNSLAHKKAIRVIKYYNISQPYATTILKLAEKLKEKR